MDEHLSLDLTDGYFQKRPWKGGLTQYLSVSHGQFVRILCNKWVIMSEVALFRLSSTARDWLFDSGFEPSAEALARRLRDLGYAAGTIRGYLSCVAHFAHWSSGERLGLESIDEGAVSRFLGHHLPVCRCAPRCRRAREEVRAALVHLLSVLRTNGVSPEKPSRLPSATAVELDVFGTYLTEVRGLRMVTRDTHLQYVRDFLLDRFGFGDVEIGSLEPADIVQFIMGYTAGWKPGSVRTVCNSLRSYLRYKAVVGTHTGALIAAIPCVAQWRLAGLPKALSALEVQTLLSAFDRKTVGGRRDYAIARCYVDLGLRTSEIVRLQLDDFDWREGTVHVRGKGRRTDVLPLPETTGRAIMAYLRKGRCETASRALFLRLRPPLGRAAGSETIRASVQNAAKRCGLCARLTGPHVLRHTLATRLVRSGASIKEISDLLRHRNLDTTTIYAKVDIEALSTVAAPWPGSRT